MGGEPRVAEVEGRVYWPTRQIGGERGPVRTQFDLAQPTPVRAMLGQPLSGLPLIVRHAQVDAFFAEEPAERGILSLALPRLMKVGECPALGVLDIQLIKVPRPGRVIASGSLTTSTSANATVISSAEEARIHHHRPPMP